MKQLPSVVVAAVLWLWTNSVSAITCSIDSASGVAFGTYDPTSAVALDTLGTLTYTCDDVGILDLIVVQLSSGSSGTFLQRTMIQGADTLNYNLYRDSTRLLAWGDGTLGSVQLGPTSPSDGVPTSLNIYARIPAQQNVPAGSYADTVTATILF